ncbi:MAG: ComEC/Rec2 family competence protein [Armatimonadota bacterium]
MFARSALWLALAAMGVGGLLWAVTRRRWAGGAVALAAALAGVAVAGAGDIVPAGDVSKLPSGGQTLVGTVANAPGYRDGRWRFVLAAEGHEHGGVVEPVAGSIFVRLASSTQVRRGESWRLSGRLRPLRTASNPGGRSEADRLSSLGVSSVLTVGSDEMGERLGDGRLGLIARHAFGAQRAALTALERNVRGPYPEATAQVASSVIFGVHATPPSAEITEAFRRAGTIHLLVVSGAVVSMVFGMVFLPGALGAGWRRLMVERQSGWPADGRGRVRLYPGLLAAAIAMVVVSYYAILTEGGQAVVRAAVMGVLVALALGLRRVPAVAREHGLNVDRFTLLGAAALVVLAFLPRALFQPGFQLSFAAVAAILYLTPKAMWLVAWLPKWLGYTVAGTLAAQLATFPILVWHFGQAPIAGFGANLLAIPLASVVLVSGMATCGLAAIAPWAAPAAGWVVGVSTRWLVWVSSAFGSLPWGSVEVVRPHVLVIVAWYAGLVGIGGALGRRQTQMDADER